MTSTAPLLLALAALFGRSYGQSATQPETHRSVLQGEAVQLNCTYKTAVNMFWYVQYPDKALEMLLYNYGEEIKKGFTAKDEKSDSTYNLRKEAAELRDSGVYFCAVSDNNAKLTFGSGTSLRVLPNIKDAKPSMYRLKADTNEPGVPESVCLVTDFPVLSNETELQLNGIKVNKDERLLLDKTEDNTWRYSSVLWNDDAKTECTVNYASNKISEIPVAEKIECSSPKIDETFKTDERLNTVSLKMLGLRFLTIKAIVFNAITTQRLWSA
uniref:Ig-like domain-containing protein n=2 Tax=Xenopus laevis TaxID=8355 RepID=Q4KLD3_XENLA|nr:Unknown (protein for MGC:116472) [Xenopus laevis]